MGGPRPDTIESLQEILDAHNSSIRIVGEYKHSNVNIDCVCNICSYEFAQTSTYLKYLRGCPACNGKVKKTVEQLQKILDLLNRNISVVSDEPDGKYQVVCNVCSYTWLTKKYNLERGGCSSCSGKLKGSLENTQKRLDEGDRNIRVSGKYTNTYSKLSCECTICNHIWTSYSHTLVNGKSGCPGCAKGGYDTSKPGYLYYLRITTANETYWKIGITNRSLKERFRSADRKIITVLYCQFFQNGADAKNAERNVLDIYREYRVKGLNLLVSSGNTEIFSHDVLQMNHLNWGSL